MENPNKNWANNTKQQQPSDSSKIIQQQLLKIQQHFQLILEIKYLVSKVVIIIKVKIVQLIVVYGIFLMFYYLQSQLLQQLVMARFRLKQFLDNYFVFVMLFLEYQYLSYLLVIFQGFQLNHFDYFIREFLNFL